MAAPTGMGTSLATPSPSSPNSSAPASASGSTQYNPGKKGRGTENQAGANATQQYNVDTGVENDVIPTVESWIQQNMPSSSGALSPYASAQYGQDVENTANTYQSLRAAGMKMLGASGFGSAPSGRESSLINTLLNQQGIQDTGAYRNALGTTTAQGNEAAQLAEGLGSEYNPNAANSQLAGIGVNQNKMGSTFSDIMQGLAVAGTIAAAPFTGGASLLGLPAAAKMNQGPSSSAVPVSYGGTAPDTGGGDYGYGAASPVISDSPINIQDPAAATASAYGGQSVPAGLAGIYAPPSGATPNFTPTSSTKSKSNGGFSSIGA